MIEEAFLGSQLAQLCDCIACPSFTDTFLGIAMASAARTRIFQLGVLTR